MGVYIINAACNWGLRVSASPESVCLLRREDKNAISVCLKCGEIYGEAYNRAVLELGRYKTLRTAKYARKKLENALRNNNIACVMPLDDV